MRLPRSDAPHRCSVGGLIALAIALGAAPAHAQAPAVPPRWEVSLGGTIGAPTGWVQVRGNAVEGTRLGFPPDLDVSRVWIAELAFRHRWGRRGALRFVVQSYALDGTTTVPGDVQFNGATLAGGTSLETRTHFPSFVRATLTGERELAAVDGGRVLASVGITFVSLMFKLQGTLAPTTAGRETHEDFVTQELPVPVVGLALAHPLSRGLDAGASALLGYLPWVNSL